MFFRQIKSLIKNLNNRSLGMIIFFVTSRCNAHCAHCFNWKNIDKKNKDLTLKEIEKMTLSMPHLEMVLFSGGEPFLRNDLFEIVSLFYSNTGVKEFNFPTNGSLPERIKNTIQKILERLPEVRVSVNFSLDGPKTYHDAKRQLPGCFSKVRQSINLLRPLRERFKSRLAIKTNTVIMPDNGSKIIELISFLEDEYSDLDDHLFELLRGDPRDLDLKRKISKKELSRIYNIVRGHRAKMLLLHGWSTMEVMFRLANLILLQKIQYNAYFGKSWGVPCLAGQTIGIVDHDGYIRHCELHRPVVNLHEYDLNFIRAWNSKNSAEERKSIGQMKCWGNCTHICFIADTVYRHIRTYIFKVPWALAESALTLLNLKKRKNV